MRIQLAKPIGALLTAGLFALPTCLQAQPTAHYPTGLEGLKAATLPPPGVYLRDYNWFYYADHVNNAAGQQGGRSDGVHLCSSTPPDLDHGRESAGRLPGRGCADARLCTKTSKGWITTSARVTSSSRAPGRGI